MKTQINAPQTQLRDTINQNNKNIETRPKTVSTMILRFKSSQINSHAVGMPVAQPLDFEIDFQETLFLDQLHDFSLLPLKPFL